MTRLPISFVLVFAAICTSVVLAAESKPRQPPNIVFLLADDLGWQDVGFHGSEIRTPNIDRLATAGVRLEQFYVQPVCSPTRASLMTGRYPIRTGLQVGVIRPWADYGLPLEERMLPQALQAAGYYTAITGKWHLGLHAPEFLPTRRGFDYQYGHYTGAIDYFKHDRMGGLDWHRNEKALVEEGYSTTLIGNEAAAVIERHNSPKPLFLYVPFNSSHSPLQAPQEYLDQYSNIQDNKRQAYAAMVTCMDDAIGRIVAALDKRNMRDDTLIFFTSDNGGPTTLGANNGPLRGAKGSLYEGGVRVPTVAVWSGKIKAGSTNNALLHMVDMYPTLLRAGGAPLDQPLPLDGKDALATITQGKPSPREEILHNLEPTRGAVRVGDWKLVQTGAAGAGKKKAAAGSIELFNIADDPNEKVNLAESQPDKVEQLLARLAHYRKEAVPPRGLDGDEPAGFKTPKVWGEAE
jgi:arylsulfatase A-like enzyme